MRKLKVKSDITISAASGNWSIRAGGAVLGETSKALKLNEVITHQFYTFQRKTLLWPFLKEQTKKQLAHIKEHQVIIQSLLKARL